MEKNELEILVEKNVKVKNVMTIAGIISIAVSTIMIIVFLVLFALKTNELPDNFTDAQFAPVADCLTGYFVGCLLFGFPLAAGIACVIVGNVVFGKKAKNFKAQITE